MITETQDGTLPHGNPPNSVGVNSRIARIYTSLSWLILVLPILLAFTSVAIQNWNRVYDDAFISYRYAQNLAMGHGITWNPGQPPTEGYTNFLLVLILAPTIWAGLDPLLVTRALSLLCVIAISGILFAVSRRRYNCSANTAFMIAAIIFLVPATAALCLVGLETVIYAFFLLTSFIAGVAVIDRQKVSHSIIFSCLLFLAMLLRPEAALIYPIIFIASLLVAIRYNVPLKSLMVGSITLLVFGGTYLVWKYSHFGRFLPNPFYLKASGPALISPIGIGSVMSFIGNYCQLLALVLSSLILSLYANHPDHRWNKIVALTGSTFIVAYCLFFAHVDTLMDDYGRFLYPLVPLVILLATPTLAKVLGFFECIQSHKAFVIPVIMVAFLLALGVSDILHFYDNAKDIISNDRAQAVRTPAQKEYRVAKALANFPQIKEVRIAFADSGVIPYFTGALWLDVVGLNDGFIARTRDKNQLVDYFFSWSPDLVIHPGKVGLSWLQTGHGQLGNYLSWSRDPRWDEYVYVGTSKIDGVPYDLQYFVRKSSRFRGSLDDFLKANVVDGWYDPFPLPIGTYYPNEITPIWWPRQ